MHIGSLTIVLYLHDTESLKDKRHIIKSLIETTRRKFNVAIAEVDDLDKWRKATLGVVTVANDIRFVNQILDKILDTIEGIPEIEVGETTMEML